MKEHSAVFIKMVDELVDYGKIYDPELSEGLHWIEEEAKRRQITFYDMVFIVLQKYDNDKKAEEWIEQKTGNKPKKTYPKVIQQLLDLTSCSNCGERKKIGYNFCPKCGVTLT